MEVVKDWANIVLSIQFHRIFTTASHDIRYATLSLENLYFFRGGYVPRRSKELTFIL